MGIANRSDSLPPFEEIMAPTRPIVNMDRRSVNYTMIGSCISVVGT